MVIRSTFLPRRQTIESHCTALPLGCILADKKFRKPCSAITKVLGQVLSQRRLGRRPTVVYLAFGDPRLAVGALTAGHLKIVTAAPNRETPGATSKTISLPVPSGSTGGISAPCPSWSISSSLAASVRGQRNRRADSKPADSMQEVTETCRQRSQ